MSTVLMSIVYLLLLTLSKSQNEEKYTSLLNKRRGISTTDSLDDTDIKSILDAHNNLRQNISSGSFSSSLPSAKNIKPLTWLPALADSSALVADKCEFTHSNTTTFDLIVNLTRNPRLLGENLASNSIEPTIEILMDMIQEWINEGLSYEYSEYPKGCSAGSVCEHFTQMIWFQTRYVGCGFKLCQKNGTETLFVCQYHPRGNRDGEYPYAVTEHNTICVKYTKMPTATFTNTETKTETEIVSKLAGEYSLNAGAYTKIENDTDITIYWNDTVKQWRIGNIGICNESQLEYSTPVTCPKYEILDGYNDTIKSISVTAGTCEETSDKCIYKGLECYLWFIIIGIALLTFLLLVTVISSIIYIICKTYVKKEVKAEKVKGKNEETTTMLPPEDVNPSLAVNQFVISDEDHKEMIEAQQRIAVRGPGLI